VGQSRDSERLLELLSFLRRDRFRPPLVVVLGEKLHYVAAAAAGLFHRFEVTAGDRHVGAEQGHES